MRVPAQARRVPRPLVAAALSLGLVLVAVACGTGGFSKGGDVTQGKKLFTTTCGGCHTLAAAGTGGTIGPNLDDAFSADRTQGFEESSIQQIVIDQIRLPLQGVACPGVESQRKGLSCAPGSSVTPTGSTVMPANLVRGQDATDVARFVAKCAGNQDDPACASGQITATDGPGIFKQAGCVTCHTLKDAGSTGTIGPNLDQKQPPKSLVVDRVTNGRGAMPPFKAKLSAAQIQAVADYVSSVAGK